jgi:hypothetical protein
MIIFAVHVEYVGRELEFLECAEGGMIVQALQQAATVVPQLVVLGRVERHRSDPFEFGIEVADTGAVQVLEALAAQMPSAVVGAVAIDHCLGQQQHTRTQLAGGHHGAKNVHHVGVMRRIAEQQKQSHDNRTGGNTTREHSCPRQFERALFLLGCSFLT